MKNTILVKQFEGLILENTPTTEEFKVTDKVLKWFI